jgi:hypothetical protein
VLVHRKFEPLWVQLPERVGLEAARQFHAHVTQSPGSPPTVNSACILRGRAGRPRADGFSRTVYYEISGAGRIDYQFCDEYRTASDGDSHRVVFILTIDLSSH